MSLPTCRIGRKRSTDWCWISMWFLKLRSYYTFYYHRVIILSLLKLCQSKAEHSCLFQNRAARMFKVSTMYLIHTVLNTLRSTEYSGHRHLTSKVALFSSEKATVRPRQMQTIPNSVTREKTSQVSC